jgi:hypothetical protein
LSWKSWWRGSPEHVAQIARVALEAVQTERPNRNAKCWVVLANPPYRERFTSPEDFRKRWTIEALRDCRRISILARGAELDVRIRLRLRSGRARDVTVTARSKGEIREGRRSHALRTVNAAVNRSRVPWWDWPAVSLFAGAVAIATALSLTYLIPRVPTLKLAHPTLTSTIGKSTWTTAAILLAASGLVAKWLRPNVEVAPLGQTPMASGQIHESFPRCDSNRRGN